METRLAVLRAEFGALVGRVEFLEKRAEAQEKRERAALARAVLMLLGVVGTMAGMLWRALTGGAP